MARGQDRSDQPTVRAAGDDGYYDMSDPREVNLNDLASRRVKTGKHLWAVAFLFHITDPEASLDDMTIGPHNMLGAVKNFFCLHCNVNYVNPTDPDPRCDG